MVLQGAAVTALVTLGSLRMTCWCGSGGAGYKGYKGL